MLLLLKRFSKEVMNGVLTCRVIVQRSLLGLTRKYGNNAPNTEAKLALKTINDFKLPYAQLDLEYLCNSENLEEISRNIKRRKGVGSIHHVQKLYNALKCNETEALREEFLKEALNIPNKSHPIIESYGENPKVVKTINERRNFEFRPKEFSELMKDLGLLRTENLGNFCGHRSYFLLGELAEMEQALVQFTVNRLLKMNFKLISVPDVLPRHVIESCGMSTQGTRTQVYELDETLHPPDMILSGTSEMALAGFCANKKIKYEDLPQKFVAVSRCYRAEISSISEEKGIYRVHQFTKVEMFGVTDQYHSEELLEEFRDIQEQYFASFGLHLQTLDMPLHELGAPAYRKYDIEAWLPGRNMFGEVSSCSNCTDYQSRRLNIKYHSPNSDGAVHAHTVNATACAVPRMLIALLETHQQANRTIAIPPILKPYMRGKEFIGNEMNGVKMKYIKSTHLDKEKELRNIKS